MSEIALLGMDDLRLAHAVLEDRFREEEEPMPGWHAADRARLETCCHCTEAGAFGEEKYPRLADKAAKLFYSGVKLHIFPNGNKRFGVMVTLLFVLLNGYQVVAEQGELADAATEVADSDPHSPETEPDRVISELASFFDERLRPSPLPSAR